jgi:CRISPR-associated protein Cas5t
VAAIGLFVSVPISSFRAPHAREYLQSLDFPPPTTVYGMLLSLVGEGDRRRHTGCELALAGLGEPARSTVLRTTWHVKNARKPPGIGENKRPDFQELLTGLRIAVFCRAGRHERASPSLSDRVAAALRSPATVVRWGGLSLGESTHLVDEVRPIVEADIAAARLLVRDPAGTLSLPIWVDHVGSAGTRWGRFSFSLDPVRSLSISDLPEDAWVGISPEPVAELP